MTEPDWKTRLKRRYEELKQQGKSFFPYTIFKDTVAVFLVVTLLAILAVNFPASLEEIADPTDTTYNPRPDWYFLFLFQALKFFPGSMEAVGAIILPTIVIILLVALPFIDRGPKRHPLDRPVLTSIGVFACGFWLVLTVMGAKSPLLNPVIKKDPNVMEGKQLYEKLRCAYCHSINGQGGTLGPDLSMVGARRDHNWIVAHFVNPQEVTPGSAMPRLNLLPIEVDRLTAYLATLGGHGPFTAKAPGLFAEHCASCHRLDRVGGDMGPDLSTVRTYRDKAYLVDYIRDPSALNKDISMPAFKDSLSAAQIEDLARYLMSPQRKK